MCVDLRGAGSVQKSGAYFAGDLLGGSCVGWLRREMPGALEYEHDAYGDLRYAPFERFPRADTPEGFLGRLVGVDLDEEGQLSARGVCGPIGGQAAVVVFGHGGVAG